MSPQYPDALPARITVRRTERNPYDISICPCETGSVGDQASTECVYAAYAFEIVGAGRLELGTGEEVRRLGADCALVLSPGAWMRRRSPGFISTIVFFNAGFIPDFMHQNFNTILPPDGRAIWSGELGEARAAAVRAALQAIYPEETYFPCMSRSMLQHAFLSCVSVDPEGFRHFLSTAAMSDVSRLGLFMASQPLDAPSTPQLARDYGRSVSAFHRDFRRALGTTPARWLMERRLSRARALLSTTSMSVTEICFETGFKDSAHFSRAFKARFGSPPTEVRARAASEERQE